ncbi:MAG: SMC-Scp complex subunit ScpB [Anaerolineaceae bacterium]|nr:SMC-Scp complex subunit ScpB [Anaerolineaceae bacterium]
MTENVIEQIPINLEAAIEAVLFVSSIEVSIKQLSETFDCKPKEIRKALDHLQETYNGRGLRLQWHADRVQLTSAPEMASLIEKYLGLESTSRLSRAGLEALAIIAYQQPITRPNIDSIRGVNSDGVLRSLLNKGLIEEIGRAETPGRPILYGSTSDFLQFFGLSDIALLPELNLEEEIEKQQSKNGKLLKD